MVKEAMTDEILTLKEVAQYLKLAEKTAYRLAAEGKLPGFKAGGSWRVKREEIEQWIPKQKTKSNRNIQIFKATINENGEWTKLNLLPFNSPKFSSGHPALNRDDSKLYFISDRPESIGKTDIYVIDIYNDII